MTNPTGRFEARTRSEFDDGWGPASRGRAQTTVTAEKARTILSKNDSPDVPFRRSINPYRGCEHGCIYCFARPSHAYLGLSPGLDFETRIFSKPNAAELLRRELGRPSYVPDVIALGANTDPYQPIEREHGITREILDVLRLARHPVSIVTKSALVLRDLDLLQEMAADGLAHVHVSITTLDDELASRMEPRASTPARRLRAIEALTGAGVPVGLLCSPIIPALNDHEIERILEAAARAGAESAGYILLRLPLEIGELFAEWLEANYPLRAEHVLSSVRDTRGGALYQAGFGDRMRGTGPYADLIETRFQACRRRLGLAGRKVELTTDLFDSSRLAAQLPLF